MDPPAENRAPLPLTGVRVVEFVHMVMGPVCGLILADLGAEVIKVEPVGGDNTRRLTGSGAGFFVTFNRNKKSLALDMSSPAGRALVERLLATADVVTENFRSGAMRRLGLDYERVRALRPEIVYCSLKGFLPGPYARRTALDEVVQMMGGLAYMTGPPGRPLRAGASVNDIMGGMFGVIAILSALRERDATGRGQRVGSALFESNVLLMAQHMAQYAVSGVPAPPMPERLSAWAIYDVFRTRDGEQLFVGVVTDSQWRRFCEYFEQPELYADPSLASNNLRVAARDRLLPRVREVFGARTRAELMQACEAIDLPFAPITRPHELFEDPHLNAAGGLLEVTDPGAGPVRVPALPLELGGRRLGLRLDAPRVGEHTGALLCELGLDECEVAALAADGVIALDPHRRA